MKRKILRNMYKNAIPKRERYYSLVDNGVVIRPGSWLRWCEFHKKRATAKVQDEK